MDDSNEKLVTVGRFMSEEEFLVARSVLDSAGIECFAPNWPTSEVKAAALYGGGLDGIVLQVRESDAQDALAILNDPGAGGNQQD